jgi:hypothetical protein
LSTPFDAVQTRVAKRITEVIERIAPGNYHTAYYSGHQSVQEILPFQINLANVRQIIIDVWAENLSGNTKQDLDDIAETTVRGVVQTAIAQAARTHSGGDLATFSYVRFGDALCTIEGHDLYAKTHPILGSDLHRIAILGTFAYFLGVDAVYDSKVQWAVETMLQQAEAAKLDGANDQTTGPGKEILKLMQYGQLFIRGQEFSSQIGLLSGFKQGLTLPEFGNWYLSLFEDTGSPSEAIKAHLEDVRQLVDTRFIFAILRPTQKFID